MAPLGSGIDDAGASDTRVDEDTAVPDEQDVETASPQAISGLSVVLLDENPTCARVTFKTVHPTVPDAVVFDARNGSGQRVPVSPQVGTTHDFIVMGLAPGRAYRVEITADTEMAVSPLETPDWPSAYPALTFATADTPGPPRLGGFRLLHIVGDGQDVPRGLVVALDSDDLIRWYYSSEIGIAAVRRAGNGDYLLMTAGELLRLDAAGRLRWRRARDTLGLDTLHHDLAETASGATAVLSTELRRLPGYPDGDENVIGDVVVEIDAAGEAVRELRLLDILDPSITSESFYNGFWDSQYPDEVPTRDWSHANAMQYIDAEDAYLLTLRHHDEVILVDAESGRLAWRLGPRGDFTLTQGEWFFHPHAAHLMPTADPGHYEVMLFDNGVTRPLDVDEPAYSRAVVYAIDTTEGTASQIWEFRGAAPFYAPIFGDVDPIGTDAVLLTQGVLQVGEAPSFARISEVTRSTPPEVRWSVTVARPGADVRVFQSDVMPTLYPSELLPGVAPASP